MKTLKYKFEIEANKTQIVEIEVADDATDEEIEREVNNEYDQWMLSVMGIALLRFQELKMIKLCAFCPVY